MIKKTITWKNYDGLEVSKDFWFHLDAGEIAEIELSDKMGYSELLRVAQENDDPTVVGPAFRKIVLGAVGRREGELFMKDLDAIHALQFSGAYSELIMWMLSNSADAAEFVNGMLPNEAQEALKDDKAALLEKMRAKTQEMAIPDEMIETVELIETTPEVPVEVPAIVEPVVEQSYMQGLSAADFRDMSPEDFEAWKASRQAQS